MNDRPVPLELRGEERLIGEVMSLRQLGYVVAGGIAAALLYGLFTGTSLLLTPLGVALYAALASLIALVTWALGWWQARPIRWLGVPGPGKRRREPYAAPVYLDTWLRLWRQFQRQAPVLPWRRGAT